MTPGTQRLLSMFPFPLVSGLLAHPLQASLAGYKLIRCHHPINLNGGTTAFRE